MKFTELYEQTMNEQIRSLTSDEKKNIKKLEKLAKKYGLKPVKISKKEEKDGLVSKLEIYDKDIEGKKLTYYVKAYIEPEEVGINFSAPEMSGNDSLEEWVDEEYWEDYFGEEDE